VFQELEKNTSDVFERTAKGASPPSHFSNKLDDKLAHKVDIQTNMTHFCLVRQSEVCCKLNWFATNSLRQLCEQVCHQVCCKNVMVEMHLKSLFKNASEVLQKKIWVNKAFWRLGVFHHNFPAVPRKDNTPRIS
jgi:hypothetical protein